MKALIFNGPEDIRYQDFQDPQIETEDSVIVKVRKSGICGSDLHIYHGGFINDTDFVVGHEFIGEIVEVGENVRGFSPGDQVLSAASIGCTDCPQCKIGRVTRCERGVTRCYGQGSLGGYLQGGQAEKVMVPAAETTLLHMPQGVSDDQAILLTDNLPTAYFGAKNAGIHPGQAVAVIGLGPVGLLSVECAFILGAARVFAIDKVPERLSNALELGAIPLTGDDIKTQIKEATKGRGVDAVIEAVGADATIIMGLALVRNEGTVSVVGVNMNKSIAFPIAWAQFKNITFRMGVCPVQAYWNELIPLVQSGRIRGKNVVTHHMKLSEGAEAYRIYDERKDGIMKIILETD